MRRIIWYRSYFTLEEINEREKAALDADLFSKLFPDGSVTTEEQLRAKIKEGAELQFNEQADQHFLNTVTDYLVDNTQFDLPAAFLKKWLTHSRWKRTYWARS